MKRRVFLRYLRGCNCVLLREGAKHSVYVNRDSGKISTVPRHRELNDFLVRKICRDLEIPPLLT